MSMTLIFPPKNSIVKTIDISEIKNLLENLQPAEKCAGFFIPTDVVCVFSGVFAAAGILLRPHPDCYSEYRTVSSDWQTVSPEASRLHITLPHQDKCPPESRGHNLYPESADIRPLYRPVIQHGASQESERSKPGRENPSR